MIELKSVYFEPTRYETLRQEFEQAFLDELNESRQVREEFYKKKENLIFEQRQQMLEEVRTFRATVAAELNELRENNEKSLFENHQKVRSLLQKLTKLFLNGFRWLKQMLEHLQKKEIN